MSTRARTDQNLLFGILALQMDFIGRDSLIAAMNAWVLDKAKPLGEILFEQGVLSVERRTLLEALVTEHLKLHGNDAEKSLASVSSLGSVRQDLHDIADPDIQASLAHVSMARQADVDPFATKPPSVGEPTSAGTRFRILRPHAKGGLGEVFVAQDQELHREVALKEIQNRYADHQHHRARFVVEAEITGGLEHPGIVPVYGLGKYADGRPFYAMRFIKGDSLQESIAHFHQVDTPSRDAGERALALRQLLGRFLDVCNAIAYAHSRGILHRDLKPGNIMLGKYGETLVVDWGLAKVLDRAKGATDEREGVLRPSAASDSAPTQMGSAIGTPEYMPPEQAAGKLDQLGPASDVCSLGATLYCLLTGRSPLKGNPDEVLRKVQRGEFPRPRQVKPTVPAALEAVCLKAMALRPDNRYPDPRALAADVERWLADEPVSAWREPWHVRAGRWTRRHQTLMAAAATGTIVLLLAAGTGAWWLDRQRTEHRRGVGAALAEVHWLQQQARWVEARAVLEQAKDRLGEGGAHDLRKQIEQARRDLDLVARLDDIRLKRAMVVVGGGKSDFSIADREYAVAFQEAGLGEVGDDPAAVAAQIGTSTVSGALVAALDDWAVCAREERRAWLLEVARKTDPHPERDRLRDPAVWKDSQAIIQLANKTRASELSPQLLALLGNRLIALGTDAEPLLRPAQEQFPNDFWINFALGFALQKGKPEEAVGYYQAALALRPGTLAVHHNLGLALYDLRRLEEAIAQYRKAIALDPKDAWSHNDLGNALRDKGRVDEAIAEYQKAIALDPKHAPAHFNLGLALIQQGQFTEARQATQRCLVLLPANHPKRQFASQLLRKCEQMLALEKKLAAILKDETKPANADEQIGLARLCQTKKHYAAAARFFAGAFSAESKLADDLKASHRYDAACFAALAAAGQGEDAAKLDDKERARLRKQALDWLRADLTLWSKQIEKGTPQERAVAQKTLRHWQQDADLAGLRDAAALDKLPEAERDQCRKLWNDVVALLKK